MTGYANKELEIDGINYEIELKSLNSKHCDIHFKIPDFLNSREIEIRSLLKKRLQRGKINLFIKQNRSDGISSYSIDKDVVNAYMSELASLKNTGSSESLLSIAMGLPSSVTESESQLSEDTIEKLIEGYNEVIDKLITSRKKEGELLEFDIKTSINNIEQSLSTIELYDQERLKNLRTRLKDKVDEIKSEIDENRYEQEILYYSEKLDINEELVRLKIHLKEFRNSLQESGMIGKKLGFISQEIGREINTIGSKANDSKIQHKVISMKEELEKIKEQTLNVF